MLAYEIMNDPVHKVKEDDKVQAVIEKFIEFGISGMPVVNDKNQMVAFISDGDIMRFIGKHKDIYIGTHSYISAIQGDDADFEERAKNVLDLNVMRIATKRPLHKVQWNENVENIAAFLGKKQIKKLPVERNGVLVGIISRGDVIRNVFKTMLEQ